MPLAISHLVKRLLFALLVVGVGIYLMLPPLLGFGLQEWLRDQGYDRVRLADLDFEPFGGELRVQGLQAHRPDGAQLRLQDSYLNINWWALPKRRAHLQGIALEGLELSLVRDPQGRLILSGLPLPAAGTAAGDGGEPWAVGIDRLSITNSRLRLALPELQRTLTLEELLVTGVRSWEPSESAALRLRLVADGTRLVIDGDGRPFAARPDGQARIRLAGLDLARLAGELQAHLPSDQQMDSGELDLDVRLDGQLADGQVGLNTRGTLRLAELRMTYQGQPQALQQLDWEGTLGWSPAQGLAMDGRLQLSGLDLTRQAAQLGLERLDWQGGIGWSTSAGLSTEGDLSLTGIRASQQGRQVMLQELAWQGRAGWTQDTGPTAQGRLQAAALDASQPEQQLLLGRIRQLQVPQLELAEGLQLTLEQAVFEEPELLHARGIEDSRPLFRAARLALGGSRLVLGEHLDLGEVVIKGGDISIVLDGDGRPRPLALLDTTGDAAGADPQAAAPLRLALAGARLDGPGRLTFTDLGVRPPFRRTLDISRLRLGGLDSGAANDWTPVELAGAVGEYSRIDVAGRVRPFSDKVNVELQGTIEALDLPPLSSYTARALGYNVQSGQLESDIELKITDDQLDGAAKLVMHKLTVKAADAERLAELNRELNMPLDSALNMLRDSDDNIRLTLPVAGDIHRPDFDLGDIINKAMGKALKTAAVSYVKYALQPYGALITLAQMAGEAANRVALQPITFAPGSAQPGGDAQPYLEKLATMLRERPGLRIQICGFATAGDRQALQQAELAKQPPPKDGKAPEPPDIPDDALLHLAEARAAAIKRELVVRGAAPERLFVCNPEIDQAADAKPRATLLL